MILQKGAWKSNFSKLWQTDQPTNNNDFFLEWKAGEGEEERVGGLGERGELGGLQR